MKKPSHLTPCFILGAARSGTRLLRDLLASSDQIAAIPYDIGYVWRQGNEFFPSDEFVPEMANARIKQKIRKTLPKLVSRDSALGARILLEKSVPNTLRPAFLHAIYPEACFIHLLRDGRAVVESSYRQWQAPTEREYLLEKLRYFPLSNYRYAAWYLVNTLKGRFGSGRGQHIWGPRYAGIDEDLECMPLEAVCARQWRRCVETTRHQTGSFERGRVLEIRYEDFVSGPDCLREVCRFLGLAANGAVIDAYRTRVTPGNLAKWQAWSERVDFDAVMREIEPLLLDLGYL